MKSKTTVEPPRRTNLSIAQATQQAYQEIADVLHCEADVDVMAEKAKVREVLEAMGDGGRSDHYYKALVEEAREKDRRKSEAKIAMLSLGDEEEKPHLHPATQSATNALLKNLRLRQLQ
mgnify:CR=1 FL=1